jgi:hypothetical protein
MDRISHLVFIPIPYQMNRQFLPNYSHLQYETELPPRLYPNQPFYYPYHQHTYPVSQTIYQNQSFMTCACHARESTETCRVRRLYWRCG